MTQLMAKPRKKPARKPNGREPIPTAEEIRAVREAANLTIEQAAEKVGVKPSTWYGWETPSQNRHPSPSHAILIGLIRRGKL